MSQQNQNIETAIMPFKMQQLIEIIMEKSNSVTKILLITCILPVAINCSYGKILNYGI
jgi:hypothetical protein